jgi:hypothetical protein
MNRRIKSRKQTLSMRNLPVCRTMKSILSVSALVLCIRIYYEISLRSPQDAIRPPEIDHSRRTTRNKFKECLGTRAQQDSLRRNSEEVLYIVILNKYVSCMLNAPIPPKQTQTPSAPPPVCIKKFKCMSFYVSLRFLSFIHTPTFLTLDGLARIFSRNRWLLSHLLLCFFSQHILLHRL